MCSIYVRLQIQKKKLRHIMLKTCGTKSFTVHFLDVTVIEKTEVEMQNALSGIWNKYNLIVFIIRVQTCKKNSITSGSNDEKAVTVYFNDGKILKFNIIKLCSAICF